MGQWSPKLGLRQKGSWNGYVFHANGEFYVDFGTYDVAITLPTECVTAGTGLPVETTEHDDGTKTVRYHADDVIDFAWTASPHFQLRTWWLLGFVFQQGFLTAWLWVRLGRWAGIDAMYELSAERATGIAT